MGPAQRPFFLQRPLYILSISTVAAFILSVLFLSRARDQSPLLDHFINSITSNRPENSEPHVIDDLIDTAILEEELLVSKATNDLSSAAAAYRKRRGRHPPPHFDQWFAYAQSVDALIVEDFFDRIYHDLNPFWGVDPLHLRRQSASYPNTIVVRNGTAYQRGEGPRPWLDSWEEMLATLNGMLPDADFPINERDETRVFVSSDDINEMMTTAEHNRSSLLTLPTSQLINTYPVYESDSPVHVDHLWLFEGPIWDKARPACPPDTPGFSQPTASEHEVASPATFDHYVEGTFIKNWTLAKSPCHNPSLSNLHGTFIEPISEATTQYMFPLFGGSKLPMNNEILLPAHAYWTHHPLYAGEPGHTEWSHKHDTLTWRGIASGGRNKDTNWHRFQRHRFLAMTNATFVSAVLNEDVTVPEIFPLPANAADNRHNATAIAEFTKWLDDITDTRFTGLECTPADTMPFCPYTSPFYTPGAGMPMPEMYRSKYLPDIDGNSFSGRYVAFLKSKSLPIKATIYDEWHDSRLIPWRHFIPMRNDYADFWGLLEYFLGENAGWDRDQRARGVAEAGKRWANRVLRREDMVVYAYRLALEWARLCSEEREVMGWAGDLEGEVSVEGNEYGHGGRSGGGSSAGVGNHEQA